MTLAVLNGADQGKVLRTGRPRISIGAASDNDLVLTDSDIHPHHFSILIEDGGWRAQTASSKQQIVIDRRWSHPETGKRGALIYAGGTEILLFPGDLDDPTIEREIQLRATADVNVPETEESKDVTRIADHSVHFSRDMRTVPPPPDPMEGDASSAPTISLPKMSGARPGERIDPLAIASMPTLAGAQIPKAIQDAAQRGMRPEIVEPVLEDPAEKRPSAWDRASRKSEPPEVIAEPESRMAPMPGSERSIVAANDDGSAWNKNAEPRAMVRVDPNKPKNAWGDASPARPSRDAGPSQPRGQNSWNDRPSSGSATRTSKDPGKRDQNAWGDRTPGGKSARDVPPSRPSTSAPGNAWGDRTPGPQGQRRSTRDSIPPPAPQQPRSAAIYSGHELSVGDIIKRIADPGLQILRDPDGDFATAIRVFGTRVLDLARTYGYRTYMITSAEPLTGKTTVAMNLAFALAEDPKRRVALIEANFRFPRFAEILQVPDRIGLLGVLEGRLQVPESIVKIADRNLVVFPSGGRHPHPAEVLASPRFKTLIAELAGTVDVAIVDAPSVKPFADANLIQPLVDGALLVVLEESTRGLWIDQAIEQIGKERVLGALYNRLEKKARVQMATERKDRLDASRKA